MICEIEKHGAQLFAFGSINPSKINPAKPEKKEPESTAIFELSISAPSLKASKVINIDMVKPIPASNPSPNR